MKDSVIRLNDFLCYVAIAVATYIGYAAYNVFGAIGGFVLGAVLAGFWLVLSGIYDELKSANRNLGQLQADATTVQTELVAIKNLIAGPNPD